MKRFLLCAGACLPLMANAAIIKWDGGGSDGLWSTAANWVGDVVPSATDDVLLDNSFFPGNYTVSLGNDSVVIQSLLIDPVVSNFITLLLPATNSIDTILSIMGAGHSIVLNRGAILKNSSGTSPGAGIWIADSIRISNGARYIHNTNRANVPVVSRLSKVAGTESGVFEFDVPATSYTLSLSGRTFGTLELSSTVNSGISTYSGTGANPLSINGNLVLNSDVVLTIGMSADVIVARDLIQAAASTFNLQNSGNNNVVKVRGNLQVQGSITESGSGRPVLELNGQTDQQVILNGSILNSVGLRINNPAGITLQSPVSIPFQLQLLNGKLRTDALNILTMADNAIYTGGSASSFVEGPMIRRGDDDFIFPVGAGSIYAPIGISGPGAVSDEFVAEYKRANPQSTPGLGNSLQSPIDHISFVEYWTLVRNAGVSVKTVRLSVTPYSFAQVLNSLVVASFSGGQWQSEGAAGFAPGAPSPPFVTGEFTSSAPVSSFNAFSIGTTDPGFVNPLPVRILSFDAVKENGGFIFNWKLADYPHTSAKFEIQAAEDGGSFKTIHELTASDLKRVYRHMSQSVSPKARFFRLRITDPNAPAIYSQVIAVRPGSADLEIFSIFPNPSCSNVRIGLVSATDQTVAIEVADISGRIVKRKDQRLMKGSTTIDLSLEDLKPGIYHLSGKAASTTTNSLTITRL